MTPERWKEIEAMFEQALDLPTNERSAFLQRSCNGDENLRREVESLLESHASAGGFIDEPSLFISDEDLKNEGAPVGQLIGAYRIVREIGRGGMGAVYLAERADEQYKKQVAIKLIKRGMDTDLVLRHFRRERQIMADLDHPNIGRLFDGGTTRDGLPYFVMEYIEGAPINEYCRSHSLSVPERLKLFLQVCSAVTYAHQHTVIHRDIKPSNIFVTREGVPKLLDFGIAKILQSGDGAESMISVTGARPMTPEYASPEQVRGEQITVASDVYSLGVVLYELLTGRFPYRLTTRSPREIERAITEEEPTKPSTAVAPADGYLKSKITNLKSLRGDLDNIVLMALRKEPERRYQSVKQFADDIRRHLESRPVLARPTRPHARIWRWSRRNPVLATAAIVCFSLSVAVFWLVANRGTSPGAPPPEKSIAVLPFQNLSADPENAYLADGIQEEILTRLSKIADLKVISRSSVQRYASKPNNLREVAKNLGVANILEGTVQKAADQVRVNVQLINAQTESNLWADKFDRKSTDIFAVESEIGSKIAEILQAKLTRSDQRAIVAAQTENHEAHELYLKARFFLGKGISKETDLKKTVECFQLALAKDPNYAAAYAGMAEAYALSPNAGAPAEEAIAKGRDAAEKAVALGENLAEAHCALGVVLAADFDLLSARRELERAIELNPNYARAHYVLGFYVLGPLGDFDAAFSEMNRAVELDPLTANMIGNLAYCQIFARRYTEAIAAARKAIELDSRSPKGIGMLALGLDLSGQPKEAIAQYEKCFEVTDGDIHPLFFLSHLYATQGDRTKAMETFERAKQNEQKQGAQFPYGHALVDIGLGNYEEAIQWLERSYRAKENLVITYIKADPLLDPVRGNPVFERLARRIVSDFSRAPSKAADEKSIAVLPFENLSNDQENAFFTDGVQDEILTSLSRVADLKVISRTSVMQYKDPAKRNLREIGQELGVANVVEGSVQRVANRVRVNAQLINARNDTHVWAQTYDGDLTDVFAIQSQIAQAIAEQLQAQISAGEKVAIARPPTTDVAANALYQEAMGLQNQPPQDQTLRHAVELLEQAVARDPKFALAYSLMSQKHMSLYFGGYDHTEVRREQANAALQKATQLQPDAGEVHLAAADYWFHGFFDYDRARAEIELARRSLPNDPKVYTMAAAMDRRQGRWTEAVRNFERAAELDPRDLDAVMNAAFTYEGLKRYSDATRMYERAMALSPHDYGPRLAARSNQALAERADIRPQRAELNAIMAEDPKAALQIAADLFFCAILERDRAATERALAIIPPEGLFTAGNFICPREWFVGYAARTFGDAETARTAFTAARSKLEKIVQEQPDYAAAWSLLGRIDAALERKEEAIREGRRACELLPPSKDAWSAPAYLRFLASIYAWTGEKDLAFKQLEDLATLKVSSLDYGDLKLDPNWDSLRGDSRFPQLVARFAPNQASASQQAIAFSEKSIAVLPFQNLTGDPANAYFADGIQEEILTRLSKIADLKVISRTSTQRYKNTSEPLSAIAQQLGVAHVLEGTVQKAADQVRVNVQLINAQTDSQMWAEEFDRKLTDIFAVEGEIATKIAETFQAKLTGAERRAISVHPTRNTEAHDLYLKGRHQWRNFYAPGYERVREYYEQAITLDPSYAPAYVGLSLYHGWAAANGIFSPDHWPLAEEALQKALNLDENLPEAYNVLGGIEVYYKRDWAAAERAFHRGLELDPNFADLHHHYGLCLSFFGRFSQAIEEIDRGLELDPFFVGANIHSGTILFFSRDYARAAAQLTKTVEMFPDSAAAHEWLAEVCAKRGMVREAITHWCTALRLNGQPENAQLIEETFKKSGFDAAVRTLGEKQLQELDRKRARREYVAPANYVFANVRRGNIDEAFKWLPKMVEEPDWFQFQVRVNPVLDPLRTDPRFEKIVGKGGH